MSLFKKPDFSKFTGSANASSNEKLSLIVKNEPVRLSGLVWKRRGGVGKYMTASGGAWELRKMELRGTSLVYYSNQQGDTLASEELQKEKEDTQQTPSKSTSSWLEQAKAATSKGFLKTHPVDDPNQPRGYLDLAEEKAMVHISFGHSGAPSPFCISIAVGITQDTKWKLSFDHYKEQTKWLAALSDVVVQCSVDDYNVQLLQAANPNNTSEAALCRPPPPVDDPPTNQNGSLSGQEKFNRLWMMEEFTINTATTTTKMADTSNDDAAEISDPNIAIDKSMDDQQHQGLVRDMRQNHEEVIKQLTEESNQKLNETKGQVESLEIAMMQAEEEHKNAMDDLRARLLKSTTNSALQDHQQKNKLEKLRREMVSTQAQEAEKLFAEKESMSVSMEKMIKSLQEELSAEQNWHQESLKSIEEEHRQKVEAEKKQTEEKLGVAVAEVKTSIEASLHQALEEKDGQIAEISAERERLRDSMEEKLKSLQEKLSGVEEKHQESLKSVEEEYRRAMGSQKEEMEKQRVIMAKDYPIVESQENATGFNDACDDDQDEFEDCVDGMN
jgi:hypothetical protein